MPVRPKRPCAWLGCGRLTDTRYCTEHEVVQQKKRKQADIERDKPFLHLYGTRWKKLRAALLIAQPLCVECQKAGVLKVATVVDHIVSHKGDLALFWDTSNMQNLCTTHHNQKTAKEDGGFNNNRR